MRCQRSIGGSEEVEASSIPSQEFPTLQGVKDTPSGLSSLRNKPDGSDYVHLKVLVLLLNSRLSACKTSLAPFATQAICLPKTPTSSPQCWQRWGPQIGTPKRRPMATLREESSIRNPNDEIERACSHAPRDQRRI